MNRHDFACMLLAVKRRHPVSVTGVAAQWGIRPDKWTVQGHIDNNIKFRRAIRRRRFA